MIYLLGLILALTPSYLIRFHFRGLPTTLLEILIVVFLIAAGYGLQVTDYSKLKKLGRINYAIAGFVLAGIISSLVSPEKLRAIGQLKAFILEPVLLFYAAVLLIKTKQQLNIVLKFLLAGATVVSLFGILQYFTFIHLSLKFWGNGEEMLRITSVFEHPNQLALYLAPLIGFFFVLWVKNYDLGLKKPILLSALAVMTIALLLTFSRGGLAALILVSIFLVFKEFGIRKTLPLVFTVLIMLFFIPSIQSRLSLGLSDASSTTHFKLLQLGVNQVLDHPLLGTGLHGFQNYNVEYPHNIFLNFWLEMGILGLISLIAIYYFVWKQYQKQPSILNLATGIFLLIVLVHGLVDIPYFKNDLSVLFWFMISLFYMTEKTHEKVIDFTKIKKGGISSKELLDRL